MKSYEFYILLGKYKRQSITLTEFQRFEMAIKQSRSFRYSYYDATGETVPHFKTVLSRTERANKTESTQTSRQDNENNPPQDSLTTPTPTSTEESSSIHPEFRRVRSKRRKKKVWHRLMSQIIKDNSILIFASLAILVILISVTVVAIDSRSKNHTHALTAKTPVHNTAQFETQSPNQLPEQSPLPETNAVETDQILAEEISTEIQVENLKTPTVPIMGLEDEILSSLDKMFLEPKVELFKIELPQVE